MKKIYLVLLMASLFTIILNDCSTIKAKYKSNDKNLIKMKSEKSESEFIIKENKIGNQWAELKSIYLSGTTIIGEFKKMDNSDDMLFNVKNIKFITNWHNGYTEGECTAAGQIIFREKNGHLESMVGNNIQILEVIRGEIRYDIDYFKGEEGTKRFKNRLDRITETVNFLKTKKLKEFYDNAQYKTEYGESFKKEIETILFPEIFGFKFLKKKNLLDKNFDLKNLDNTDDVVLVNEMIWHKSYTKAVLPENLQSVRDSGSMYKDFEEALDIFFVLYNLDYYFNKKINNTIWFKK